VIGGYWLDRIDPLAILHQRKIKNARHSLAGVSFLLKAAVA
jgi:hypothetical protein